MKRLACVLLILSLLLTGCAAKQKEDVLDMRPLVEFAKAQLDAKMYAEGVKLYRISETRVAARTGENEYTVEIFYAVSGGEKESYVYHIVMENGACTLIEEKAGFA